MKGSNTKRSVSLHSPARTPSADTPFFIDGLGVLSDGVSAGHYIPAKTIITS